MKRLTASRLSLLLHCLGAALIVGVDEVAGEPAERGVSIHGFLEDVNRLGREAALERIQDPAVRAICAAIDLERMPVDPSRYAAEVAFAFDVVSGTARELGRGVAHLQLVTEIRTEAHEVLGVADYVGLVGEDAVLVGDYKTGRAHLPDPDQHAQLRFLGLAAARAYGRDRAVVELIRIREDGSAWRERGELDLFELAEVAEQISVLHAEWVRHRAAGTLPVLRVGEHCKRCRAARLCPAQTSLALSLVAQPSPTVDDVLRGLTVENAGEVWGRLEAGRALLDRVEEALETFGTQTTFRLPDGRMFGLHETKRDKLDGTTTWRMLAERYGEDAAWSAVQIKATKSGVDKVARAEAQRTKSKIKHVNDAILKELAERGGLRTYVTSKAGPYRVSKGRRGPLTVDVPDEDDPGEGGR